MKKMICILTAFCSMTAFSLCAAAETGTFRDQYADPANYIDITGENGAYALVNGFVTEQKESGSAAFALTEIYPERLFSKVVVLYDAPNMDAVTEAVTAFAEEKGISDLVVCEELPDPESDDPVVIARRAGILLKRHWLEQLEANNPIYFGNNNVSNSYDLIGNDCICNDDQVAINADYHVFDAFYEDVCAVLQANGIDTSILVLYRNEDGVEPAETETAAPTRRETILALNSTLKEYLRENKYFAVTDPETDAEAENYVKLTFWLTPEEAETFDQEAVQAGVRSACEAKSLDPALVKVIFETETGAAADGEALWETRTALEDFIAEKGYNVRVFFIHNTTLPEVYGDAHAMIELSFAQAPASDMNRNDRISAEIGSMLQEKGLTGVPVMNVSFADTAAPGESEATETTTTATETAATEAASTTTTTTAAATTTTAAATTAAGTTTAAPPETGDRAETGMLAAGIASLLAAAACTKRRKE